MTGERVERLRRNHRDEIDSAVLYDAVASAEREERLAGASSVSGSPEGQQFPAVAVWRDADERRPIRT